MRAAAGSSELIESGPDAGKAIFDLLDRALMFGFEVSTVARSRIMERRRRRIERRFDQS